MNRERTEEIIAKQREANRKLLDHAEELLYKLQEIISIVDQNLIMIEEYDRRDRDE